MLGIILSVIRSTVVLALFTSLCACEEKPTVVTREQLKFVRDQQKPLLVGEVFRRLGTTPRFESGVFEPVCRYTTDGGKTSIEFWVFDFPEERLRHMKPNEPIPEEVSIVVETAVGIKPRIIWPPDLVGSDIGSVLRATWPKIYGRNI